MKKWISMMVAVSILTSITVFGEVVDNQDMTVTITENTEIKNTVMDIEILSPGYEFLDLLTADKTNYLNMIAYRETLTTDANGGLNGVFVLRDDALSGYYTVMITGDGYGKTTKEFLINDIRQKNLLDDINLMLEQVKNGAATDTDGIAAIKAALMQDAASMGVLNTVYCNAMSDGDWERVAELACTAIKLLPEYAQSGSEILLPGNVAAIMNKAVGIIALKKGLVTNILDDAETFAVEEGELASWYRKDYVTAAAGQSMVNRLKNRTYNSFAEFDKDLTEAFVLSVMEKPDGVDNAREIMNGFHTLIGVGTSGSDQRYTSVSNRYFATYQELAQAFNSYQEQASGQPSGSGGGGGGSSFAGGGGAYVPNTGIESPKTPDKDESLPLNIFSDIDTVPWAEDAIVALAEKGVIFGKGIGIFAPNDYVTREEFVTMLVRAFLDEQEETAIVFTDVPRGEWYYSPVAKAVNAGVVKGINEVVFGTGDKIIRQDMAVMIYRIADYADAAVSTVEEYASFDDHDIISSYAREAVYALKNVGIIAGVDEYNFAPFEPATRAQAAKMIYALLML